MKIKESRIQEIIEEEFIELVMEHVLTSMPLNESLDRGDYKEIKDLIRAEVAAIMFDLFKKKSMWL